MADTRIPIMQMIGTLEIGGAERMAVNLANEIPRDRFEVHLCTTRDEGPLVDEVSDDVSRLALTRKSRLSDIRTVWELVRYIRRHNIRLLHCHQYTVFLGSLAALFCPSVALVWHDHFGPMTRPRWLYRIGTFRVGATIAVSDHLAEWARESLGFADSQVHVVQNFVTSRPVTENRRLPSSDGCRIVSVGNLHPVKGALILVDAMARVVVEEPQVQALIVGGAPDLEYFQKVKGAIRNHGLDDRVILLGQRQDVAEILAQSDVGVLSSQFEGLPLALIEYGMAGLPSISTRVGQCAEVLGDGKFGIIVPPNDAEALAKAILRLVRSKMERESFGLAFRNATIERYSAEKAIGAITDIYEDLLESSHSD